MNNILSLFLIVTLLLLGMNPAPNEGQVINNWTNIFNTEPPLVFGPTGGKCDISEGVEGNCVPSDQCKDGNIVTNGWNRLTPRISNSCSQNEVCCLLNGSSSAPATSRSNQHTSLNPTSRTSIAEDSVGCGVRQENGISFRISGDMTAVFGEFPWAVAVFKVVGDTEEFRCGASLIHPRAALTAALPVQRGKCWRIRAGEYDILSTTEWYPHQSSDVQEVVTHKQFNSGRFSHNIALLFLATTIRPANNVGFACLAQPKMITPPGATCIVTGWGQDKLVNGTMQNVMKMLELPVVARSTCQSQLRTVASPRLELDATNICAGGEGNAACRGDAGSPLVCPYEHDSTRYYQAGIVSFGVGCGENGIPEVYTNVAELRGWVDSTMRDRGYSDSTYTHLAK